MLSGWDGSTAGEGLAAQACWFCPLFTHFQWLIPEESEGTSTTWCLWHCQLLLPPHCHHLGVLTGISSPLWALLWYDCLCGSAGPLLHLQKFCFDCPHWTICAVAETVADAKFYGDLDPQLHLLGINVRSDLSDKLGIRKEGDTVIPPLWLPVSHCNAIQCAVLHIHLGFLRPNFTGQTFIEGISSKAMFLKQAGPSDTHSDYLQNTKCLGCRKSASSGIRLLFIMPYYCNIEISVKCKCKSSSEAGE